MKSYNWYCLILIMLAMMLNGCLTNQKFGKAPSNLKKRSLQELRQVLNVQSEWVKVHAAEYLLWTGNAKGVKEKYLEEEWLNSEQPQYRIGIWRVLAQASTRKTERDVWINKIKSVFLDSNAPDRIHAAETLAKLKISPLADNKDLTETTLKNPVKALALYTLWSVSYSNPEMLRKAPSTMLGLIRDADDVTSKTIPAYALRQLNNLTDEEWNLLSAIALKEPLDSPSRIYLLSAAFVTAKGNDITQRTTELHREIVKYKSSTSKSELAEMCAALAEKGTSDDLLFLDSLFYDLKQLANETDKADVAAAAAYAILKIKKRE